MTTDSVASLESKTGQNAANEVHRQSWPRSFDWALLCLRGWFGLSIFTKHGIEKILFFHSTAATFPDPIHIGRTATLAVALFADAICSILTVVGLATRWAALVVFANIFVAWTMNGSPDYFGHGVVADHGELIWLYLGANAALVIMGSGRFSLDWKLRGSKFARLLRLEMFSPSTAEKPLVPTVQKSTWVAIVAVIVTGAAWAVWMQRTRGSSAGQSAPGFDLPSQDGSQISLSQFSGKSVVLYFYSKDSNSQDTIEALNFQRDLAKYTSLNTALVGVSPDSVADHKEFATKNSITYPLLSADRVMIDSYGIPVSGSGENLIVERDTLLISPQGIVTNYWPVKDVQAHSNLILAAIAATNKRR